MSPVQKKIDFILELEKLKAVLRQTKPHGLDRFENSAEHSWQSAMAALILLEDAPSNVDALTVLKMMLIHDIVEIDAGDVFTYDEAARADVAVEEEKAARRIFGLLENPLGEELLNLWLEFEAGQTPCAKFAKAIDRVCPVIQNLNTSPNSWQAHRINRERVVAKNEEIQNANPELWTCLKRQIDEAEF